VYRNFLQELGGIFGKALSSAIKYGGIDFHSARVHRGPDAILGF
jgi:hypothetical protein